MCQLGRDGDEDVGLAEIAVVFRNLVFEDQLVSERIPGQLADKTVILVQIVPRMRQDELGVDACLEHLERLLDLPADVRKEAVAEAVDDDLAGGSVREERRRARSSLVGSCSFGSEHHPGHVQVRARSREEKQGRAASDLDVVCVASECEDASQRLGPPDEWQSEHD